MQCEVTLGYYKTVVADSESEAVEKAHSGDWESEGTLTVSDDAEVVLLS